MSDKREVRGPDGQVAGTITAFALKAPTKRSSGAHLTPTGSEGHHRLTVWCRRSSLLAVYGPEPATLLGTFAADTLHLRGGEVVTHRPDLQLGALIARQPLPVLPVVADSARPLQLWCPNHTAGHDVDPAQLRAELSNPSVKGRACPIQNVEARQAAPPADSGA